MIDAFVNADIVSADLTPRQFEAISSLVYRSCGIRLQSGKEGLVKSRLIKRLRVLGMNGFEQYIAFLQSGSAGDELISMIDSISTNKTSFFREDQHFEFMAAHVLPRLSRSHEPVRFWSAGCSSGEEPFSIAILLAEKLPPAVSQHARILATDISTKILAEARGAIYDEETIRDVPPMYLQKHFRCLQSTPPRRYQLNENIRTMVRYARLNLLERWPMSGRFSVIFCRNVMIYFDRPTREALVNRFWDLIEPGGYLFVGHAESLTGLSTKFRYVQPAIYGKSA